MTSAETEAMTALRELLDERQRYEGWIKALDARRDAAAPQVYERVRGDYLVRLERVVQRLTERREQLQATVDTLLGRREQLVQREAERTEVRQEAELRAVVGEYSQAEWDKLRDDADLEIAEIEEERTGVETELAELQQIMQRTTATAESISEPESVAPSAETAPAHVKPDAPSASPAEPQGETPSIDDFVADWPVAHVDAPGTAQASSSSAPRSSQPSPFAPPPPPPPTRTTTPMFTPPKPEPVAAPAVAASATEPSTEIRREQEKTLKCPECGAFNYATEWYCERCGGELATY